jgi:hypothetical protein
MEIFCFLIRDVARAGKKKKGRKNITALKDTDYTDSR